MKESRLPFGLLAIFHALFASIAMAAPPSETGNRAADVAALMQKWQSRVPSTNLAKLSRLTSDRLSLAQRATSVEELELALVEAPIAAGAKLGALLDSRPSGITMIEGRSLAKAGLPPHPPSWSNLAFTSITACRILDSRVSQGGSGPWPASSSNAVKIGPYSNATGGYATGPGAQGGSSSGCFLNTFAGPGEIAVIVAAVSTVSQTEAGYLTFYKQGEPNPGAFAVSQWYQPGYVQTSFVLIPTDLVGQVTAMGFTSATTDVIIDLVGFFATPDFKVIDTDNTASGKLALNYMFHNDTGTQRNTADGFAALFSNSFGTNNTAVGYRAAQFNTAGSNNIAIGARVLSANTSGNTNIAIGVDALSANTTGSGNVAIGEFALQNSTGSFNIAIGLSAGRGLTTGSGNIVIGNTAANPDASTIRIGELQARAFIAGIRGVTTDMNDAIPVMIDSLGQLGTASSSRRHKEDIADMDAASAALTKLRPVTFHYKSDQGASGRRLQYGLIAEEVAEVYPGLVTRAADGAVETVMYQFLPSMLLNEYQKQQRTIEMQATHIVGLERDRQWQSAALASQAAEIAALKAVVARIERQTAHLASQLDRQDGGTATTAMELK